MDKKITGIVAYLSWIGWIIAFLAGDKEGAKFHLNQALVIMLAGIIGGLFAIIPYIGGIITSLCGIFLTICWILGLIYACKDEEKEVPFIGQIRLLK